jgi:hypothetical protein
MKKLLFIACVLMAGTSFAQRNKVEVDKEGTKLETLPTNTNTDKGGGKKIDVNKPTVNGNVNTNNGNKTTKTNGNKPAARSSADYHKSLEGVVHSEFGKSRAAAAKAPANDEEANARISELRSNSKEGLEMAEKKIEIARERLDELKAAGEISEEDYNAKMSEVEAIEKRKNALKSSVK